jgi:hypothetical protein
MKESSGHHRHALVGIIKLQPPNHFVTPMAAGVTSW